MVRIENAANAADFIDIVLEKSGSVEVSIASRIAVGDVANRISDVVQNFGRNAMIISIRGGYLRGTDDELSDITQKIKLWQGTPTYSFKVTIPRMFTAPSTITCYIRNTRIRDNPGKNGWFTIDLELVEKI